MKTATFLALVCLFMSTTTYAAKATRPNIVVVMADDLGWNHNSIPQATKNTHRPEYHTPHLKALADNGCAFVHAYMQPTCAPTRACLMTGQYPTRRTNDMYSTGPMNQYARTGPNSNAETNFRGQDPYSQNIHPGALTLPRAMRRNGYATAHIGKYHCGSHRNGFADKPSIDTRPENMGFDINVGGCGQGSQGDCFASKNTAGEWVLKNTGEGAFDKYAGLYTTDYAKKYNVPTNLVGTPKHICDIVSDAMEETIDTLSAKKKPFYLQVHTYAVHGPVKARPDFKAKALERMTVKGKNERHDNYMSHYYGFVEGFDNTVGRLVSKLNDPNGDGDTTDSMLENTVIMVTSDNGGIHADNLPLKGTKIHFYEGGTRVPLIISWPGQIPAGTVSERNVHAVDFYPTHVDLAGNKFLPKAEAYPLDGYSFKEEFLKPGSTQPREAIHWFSPTYIVNWSTPLLSSVATYKGKNYRVTYLYEGDKWELFNLTDDPSEMIDIATQEPQILKTLANQSVAWLYQDTIHWAPRFPICKKTGKQVGIKFIK